MSLCPLRVLHFALVLHSVAMTAAPIDIHSVTKERLSGVGQRYTESRREIIDALSSSPHPITVPDLMDAVKGLAQSSTYRNLAVLEDAGVVRRVVSADDTARYELAEDLTGHHHHHLICQRCSAVLDIDVPQTLESYVHGFSDEIASLHNFRIDHHRLDLIGICAQCSAADR